MSISPKKSKNQQIKKTTPTKLPINEKLTRSRSVSQSNRDTHSCRKNKFISQLDHLHQQLLKNKTKLCSCLEIYTILENSQQNQRCLQHNNSLSLYCLNERRILCVNCLYGIHRHRSHKVLPLKDAMQEVLQDNKKLKIIIDEQIHKLDYYTRTAEENKVILETELRKTLNELDKDYNKRAQQMKQKYDRCKMQLKQNMVPLIEKCQISKKQLGQFRYKIWQSVTKYTTKKSTDDSEIMKQLLFVSCRPISKSQVQSLTRRYKV